VAKIDLNLLEALWVMNSLRNRDGWLLGVDLKKAM